MVDVAISTLVPPLVEAILGNLESLPTNKILGIKSVKQDLKKLESNLSSIQKVLEDAEERQLDVGSQASRDWLEKLKQASCDAEDLLDIFATEISIWKRKQQQQQQQVRCFRQLPFSVSKLRFNSVVAHKIEVISERIDVITKEKKNFHLQEKQPLLNSRLTTSSVDETGVLGRESDKEELIQQIVSNGTDFSVIPIVGMGGLGKTTLAQLVFNDERVKNRFESMMWVCVTAEFDYHRILRGMLEFHTDDNLRESSLGILESRFQKFLGGKNFLLVLDDVWTEDTLKWNPLMTLLKKGSQGSRVLVTTRNTGVSKVVGTEPPCTLEVLSDNESWSLFKSKTFTNCNNLNVGLLNNLEKIGQEIVGKCKGLPLAVNVMGGLLRGDVNVRKWEQISKSGIWEIEGIMLSLKLSYDFLPSNLKQCFAYCSLFPKGYDFDREDLIQLWMAQGLIQPSSGSGQSLEQAGIEHFEELLTRSFFQSRNENNKVTYRMHDLIHELAVSVSTLDCCNVTDNNKPCNFSEETRHVSLFVQDLESPTMQIIEKPKKLRTLLLPGDNSRSLGKADLNKMFHSLNYIRVLDLSSTGLVELPGSIEELKLLRYLDLSRNKDFKVLPNSVCNLYNLQTLKLIGCDQFSTRAKLPDDIGKMVKLRYLELDEMFWNNCKVLPSSMRKLTNLQDLINTYTHLFARTPVASSPFTTSVFNCFKSKVE